MRPGPTGRYGMTAPADATGSGNRSSEVAIILVTFNSARYLPACLEGIRALAGIQAEIVVIDNASTDASVALAGGALPAARVVRSKTNEGFAAAVNRGIAMTRSPLVLLVNPDCRLEPNYASILADSMQAWGPRCGSATGKLLRGTGDRIAPTAVVDSLGIRMTRNGRHLDIDAGAPDSDDERIRECFGVSGAAAMYRREMLDDVAIDGKPFDQDFFTWREDADLAWRARLMGWSAISVPRARAFHVRTVTPERRRALPPLVNYHGVKNRFLLRINNEGTGLALRNFPFELARDFVVLVACVLVERSSLPAFSWLWKHRKRLFAKRRKIQSRRRVKDGELARWFL
jgi:GT2 family glycosyltransferase